MQKPELKKAVRAAKSANRYRQQIKHLESSDNYHSNSIQAKIIQLEAKEAKQMEAFEDNARKLTEDEFYANDILVNMEIPYNEL